MNAARSLATTLAGWVVVLLLLGCSAERSHYARVQRLSLDAEPAQLRTHQGEARPGWRVPVGGERFVDAFDLRGKRVEVAVAPVDTERITARLSLETPDRERTALVERTLDGEGWASIALEIPEGQPRGARLVFEVTSTNARGAVDWGEPIALARDDAQRRPNIVLVTLDTTRADVAARPEIAPHLAALAERGVAFVEAWSPATSTTPAHASILTGLTVDQHGAVSNQSALRDDVETLAEALTRRGYQTAASVTVDHLGLAAGFGQGFGRFRTAQVGDAADGARSLEAVEGWLSEWSAQGSRPFFLWVHLFDPHTPYGAPSHFIDNDWRARGQALPPKVAERPTVPIFPGPLPTPLRWLAGVSNHAYVEALYESGVAYADALTGALLDHLARLGVEDDTLVVVTADHGEALGEQGVYYQHAGLWPATLHVPLVVAGPGWPEGVSSRGRVSTIDVFPSILASADGDPESAPLRLSLEAPDPDRRVWFAEAGLAQIGFRDGNVHYAEALAPGQFGVVLERDADEPRVRSIQRYAPGSNWLFDWRADPMLERNLHRTPGTGLSAYRASVGQRVRNATRVKHRSLTEEERAELEALGYVLDASDGPPP